MTLEIKILSKEEALENKDFDQLWDFDNTIVKENSAIRLCIAYLGEKTGIGREIAFKYNNNLLKEFIFLGYEFLKNLDIKESWLLFKIVRSLDYSLSYKIKLCSEELSLTKLVNNLKGCPLSLVDYVVDNLSLDKEKIKVMDNKKIRICSRNDVYIIKRFLLKRGSALVAKQPIEVIANKFEKNDKYYTGKMKSFIVRGDRFAKYSHGKEVFNGNRFFFL